MRDERVKWSSSQTFAIGGNGTYSGLLPFPALALSARALIVVQVAYFASGTQAQSRCGSCVVTFTDTSTLTLTPFAISTTAGILNNRGFSASDARFAQGGTFAVSFNSLTSGGPVAISALLADGTGTGIPNLFRLIGTASVTSTIVILPSFGVPDRGKLTVILGGDQQKRDTSLLTFVNPPSSVLTDPQYEIEQNVTSAMVGGFAVASGLLTYTYPMTGGPSNLAEHSTSADPPPAPPTNHEPMWLFEYLVRNLDVPVAVSVPARLATIVG